MLHGSFFSERLGGETIREWMFNTTAGLDPKAGLFLNDFDVLENGQLTQVRIETNKMM